MSSNQTIFLQDNSKKVYLYNNQRLFHYCKSVKICFKNQRLPDTNGTISQDQVSNSRMSLATLPGLMLAQVFLQKPRFSQGKPAFSSKTLFSCGKQAFLQKALFFSRLLLARKKVFFYFNDIIINNKKFFFVFLRFFCVCYNFFLL